MRGSSTKELEPAPALVSAAPAVKGAGGVTVACVYQGEAVREWAQEACMRVAASAGATVLRVREWKLGELSEPQVLAAAVVEAAKADVVVVGMEACRQLPDDLFAWVVAWLPRRPRDTGALVAVVCQPKEGGGRSRRAQEYLRAVARARGMEFILEERKLPAMSA